MNFVETALNAALRNLPGKPRVARMLLHHALHSDPSNLTALRAANWIDLGLPEKALETLREINQTTGV